VAPKPDYIRVKVRRRLQRMGAVALKRTVYVLPRSEQAFEDFQWLRREIVHEGGQAVLCAAGFLEGATDAEIEALFRSERDAEYLALAEAARDAAHATEADLDRLRRQLAEVCERDFFGGPARVGAERALAELATRVRGAGERAEQVPAAPLAAPRGAVWVTRQGVHVDRMATAWLIRRFIDPRARFKFVPATGYEPAAGELRFDMFEGEFTHEGDRCTFETLLARFALDDPALRAVADVVHDLDCKDDKFGREEAAGIATVVRGIALAHADDPARIRAAEGVFEGLYAHFRAGRT
jgi:hypothetical protein